ncbi:hypothetical protein C0995_001640 [Termitomyces sp. Mi166|nr:hypothetical protein C0995_001640 [Termitomyces sp. Mi166\
MAALLSRRCLGTLGLQQGPGFALAGPSRLAVRGYAATKQKPPAAAKAAPKTKPTSSAATPKKPASVPPTPKAAPPAPKAAPKTKPTSSAATSKKPALVTPTPKAAPPAPKVVAKKPAVKSTSTQTVTKPERPKLLKAGGGLMYRVPEKKEIKELSEEEQLAQLERAMSMSDLYPTRDIWGQAMETLDVILPHSTSFSHRSNYSSWREMYQQFKENRYNDLKNYTSMLTLARDNAIPGVDLSGHRWWHKLITQWPWRLASTTSVSESSWLTSLRKSTLDTYRQLNTALAKGDDHTIKELASGTYQDQILRLKKKQNRDCKYIWHFHKEVTPARVLSIRAMPAYLAAEQPKFGNRNVVQALVRIDTEQSLEIYTHSGVPLHTRAEKRVKGSSSAEPARVTEYFVFEKKMWYDGPWIMKEQMWEAPGRKAAV